MLELILMRGEDKMWSEVGHILKASQHEFSIDWVCEVRSGDHLV